MRTIERFRTVLAVVALGTVLACQGNATTGDEPQDDASDALRRRKDAGATGPTTPATTMTTALALGTPSLTVKPGSSVTLAMRFDAVPLGEDDEVFVHFCDASGQQQSAFNGDHAPSFPTSTWSGPIAYDHVANIPADAKPGTYSIRIGLYKRVAPYDRVPLGTGPGVTVDEQLRYTVGTLVIGDGGTTTTPPPSGGPVGQNAADYVMAFDDEFDTFDASRWNDHIWYETGNATKNYTVEGGRLKIWPQRDASGAFFNRTIDTDGKYTQQYGYFEIQAKLTVGKGTWPAFWLFNHIGARRPEIDVLEAYPGGGPSSGWGDANLHPIAFGSTIWVDANQQGGYKMIATPDLSAAMHTYGLKWEANQQTFYFDGQPKFTQAVSMPDPMYIMLDLWFGSASGTPDATTPTGPTNAYEVEYVRAWRFK